MLDDPTICDSIIDFFNKAHKLGKTTPGVLGADSRVDTAKKASTDFWLGNGEEVGPPTELRWEGYINRLDKFIESYIAEFELQNYMFEIKLLPQIQWYKPGEGFYEWHVDGAQTQIDRALVFMTYLNDVPDGGTEFKFQNTTTVAKKGKTLIWPAGLTHLHRGQISKEHHKYIMTGWLNWT